MFTIMPRFDTVTYSASNGLKMSGGVIITGLVYSLIYVKVNFIYVAVLHYLSY